MLDQVDPQGDPQAHRARGDELTVNPVVPQVRLMGGAQGVHDLGEIAPGIDDFAGHGDPFRRRRPGAAPAAAPVRTRRRTRARKRKL